VTLTFLDYLTRGLLARLRGRPGDPIGKMVRMYVDYVRL
jgi:hypothetical protein